MNVRALACLWLGFLAASGSSAALGPSATPGSSTTSAPTGPAAAPQDGADPQRAIARYQDYLARKPFHEWGFEKLVEAAIEANRLQALVEDYEKRLAENERDASSRVVLARLHAHAERWQDALECLQGLEVKDARFHKLLGELHLARNHAKEAVAALDLAAAATEDKQLLEEIHARRGEAWLAAGDREKAAAAFSALADLDPESFHLRLDAAERLTRHGLAQEALAQLEVARELAGDDNAKRCKVLAEMGRLHEGKLEVAEALVVYREAIALMSRGNWLKRDLYDRILAAHTRSGTLDELVERSREDAEARADDLDAREFHALVLVQAERLDEARDALRAAASDFGDDLALSRRLIEVLERLEDKDGVIEEYQRILAQRPDELDLYVELGRVFASEGRLEQARLQWTRTLEQRLRDAGLCVRLAELYAYYEMPEDAVAMYEKAIELEPREMRHYTDLAAYLALREEPERVASLLERAEGAAQGDAGQLEELAGLLREHGAPERARAAVEAALELNPSSGRLLGVLADLLVEEGNVERATEVLHRLINTSRETALRGAAVDRLVRLFRRQDRLDELLALERAAVDGGTEEVAPYLVLGKLYLQRREPDQAAGFLRKAVELDPKNEDARRTLARLIEDQGELHQALQQYEDLIEAVPKARRRYLKEMARIHLALLDQDAAFACYDEMLATAPDNPAAFKEVADAYAALGLTEKALEYLQQAVRLKPEDGRYRLELAAVFKRAGDWDRARSEILHAVRDRDEDVREDARQEYYTLLSESGAVEEEVERLRGRIDQNPYDSEAPLALTDIYVRELEYELALELLERLLTFQPKEKSLLEERARLYALMERHDEALLDFEKLWKLPDADRQGLALRMAEVAIEKGDLARAAQALSGVHDSSRVSALYQKHDLFDKALVALEQGIARAPGDTRLLMRLTRLHTDRGDRAAAAEALERIRTLRGDSWRLVKRLGELYHEMGKTEEALALGESLFRIVRLEEPDDEENEDEKAASNSMSGLPLGMIRLTSSFYGGGQQYAVRLREIQTWFDQNGFRSEFLDIGLREARLQPSNMELVNVVLSALARDKERAAEGLALIEHVREHGKRPATMSESDWERTLEQRRSRVYSADEELAAARVEELAAGEPSAESYAERAALLGNLRKDEERLALLREGVERYPDSYTLLAGLTTALESEKEYAEAAELYPRLIPLLEAAVDEEEDALEAEIAFKRTRTGLLQGFPMHLQRRVGDDVLRRLQDMSRRTSTVVSWSWGAKADPDAARYRLAQCLFKLDRDDEAREVVRRLEPDDPEALAQWAALGALYFEAEAFDDAREIFERLRDQEEALATDPLLGFQSATWMRSLRPAMASLARIYERGEQWLEAYDLFRRFGTPQSCELLLVTNELHDEVEAHLRETMTEYAGWDPEDENPAARVRWRNAGVQLAELHQFKKDWEGALAAYEAVVERLPEDLAVREAVAALHDRAGDHRRTIAAHYELIEAKRRLNRRPDRRDRPEGTLLTPIPPPKVQEDEDWVWSNMRYGFGRNTLRYNPRENYISILKLHLDHEEITEAVDLLRQIAREDARSFTWMGYSISQLMQQYSFGVEGIPILRMLYGYNPDEQNLALEYGRILVRGERWEEADRVLNRLVNKDRLSDYYRDQARRELKKVEAALGKVSVVTTDELRAKVEEDPKNVKSRMDLARQLFSEEAYEDALLEARAAAELAPHLAGVRTFLEDCLQVCGRSEELEQRLEQRFEEERNADAKWTLAVQLAHWRADRGDIDGAGELLQKALEAQSSNSIRYAPSSWYLERGDFERAEAALRDEIELMGETQSRSLQARARLTNMQLAAGRPVDALAVVWEQLEEGRGLGPKTTSFTHLAGVLVQCPDFEAAERAIDEACPELGDLRCRIYRAALLLARLDLEGAERAIDELVQLDPETRYLYPVLVTLARNRGDLRAAIAYLDRVEKEHAPGERMRIQTSVGSLSERQALVAEKGSLLFELGERDAALALWREQFDPEEDVTRDLLTQLYAKHGMYAEAAELLRAKLLKHGERSAGDLTTLADFELELGNAEAAVGLYERALILTGSNGNSRAPLLTGLVRAHRSAGTLRDYYEALALKVEEDPDDLEALRQRARVAVELGEDEEGLRCIERIAERPQQARTVRPFHIQLLLKLGRAEEAVAIFEKILEEPQDDWLRQNFAQQLGAWWLRQGDVQKAVEAMRTGYGTNDPAQGAGRAARVLIGEELYEEALPLLEEALESNPDDDYSRGQKAECLAKIGREAEALELLFEQLEESDLANPSSAPSSTLLRLAEATGEDRRIADALEEAGEEAEEALLHRAAALAHARKDWEELDRLAGLMLARDAENQVALRYTWDACIGKRDVERAAPVLRRIVELADREQGVVKDSWNLEWASRNMRETLCRLHLYAGDVDKAVAAWESPVPMRHRNINAWSYSYSNSPLQSLQQDLHWYHRHGLHERFLEQHARVNLLQARTAPDPRYYEALFRAGREEEALETLWDTVSGRTEGLVAFNSGVYFSPGMNARLQEPLYVLHCEAGRLDALLERARAASVRNPDDEELENLYVFLLRRAERWEALLPFLDARLEDSPRSAALLVDRARTLKELGRFEQAADDLELALTIFGTQIPDTREERVVYSSSGPIGGGTGPVRFSWAGTAGGMSSYTTYSSSSISVFGGNSGEVEARRMLMALSRKLGRGERADELERVEQDITSFQTGGMSVKVGLATAYADLGLAEDVERLLSEVLADPRGPDEFRQAAHAWAELGDEERRMDATRKYVAEVRRRAEEEGREQTGYTVLRIRVIELGEAREARAEVEALVADSPYSSIYRELLGWTLYECGETAAALEAFREAERLYRCDGRAELPPDLELGIGLAGAALEGVEAHAARLRRAQARNSSHPRASEVEKVLGG